MTVHQMLRSIAGIVAVLLLVTLALTGIGGGLYQWPHWDTIGTRLQSGSQILAGVFAILVPVTRFKWKHLHRVSEIGFVACLVVAGGLAPVVWSGATASTGLLAAVAAVAAAGVILWMFRYGAGSFGLMESTEH